jgi:hypothetical protein
MEHEELVINGSNNETLNNNIELNNNKNNYITGDNNNQIDNYKKYNDKEVTNKIKYELEKDLIKKQKQSYNNKRNKLLLLDLETEKDKNLKDIENILEGGVTDTNLRKLENKYKYNKEITELINSYKIKKSTIENNTIISNNLNDSNTNSIQLSKINTPKIISNRHTKNRNYTDLFNKNLTREEIIKNKLRIYKDKISKPFLEKVEKEKKNEYKRIQILNKINDPNLKENMETKFAIERGKVEKELTQEKERINKSIKNYEENLLKSENLDNVVPKNSIFFE